MNTPATALRIPAEDRHALTSLDEFLSNANNQPKPFVRTATVERIMAKVEKCHAICESQRWRLRA